MVTSERSNIDLLKARPDFFKADLKPSMVHLGPVRYLTLTGGGVAMHREGQSDAFQDSVDILYGVAYAVKGQARLRGFDFRMPALQATWLPYHCFGDAERDLHNIEVGCWRWKLMIMVPGDID